MSSLFEAPPLKPAGGIKDSTASVGHAFGLDHMDVGELLDLRAEIEQRLPAMSLKDMNMEESLVEQYLRVKALQTQVMGNDEIPANQLAQVAGQVSSILQVLVKMQIDVGRDEQMKRIEDALLEAVRTLPDKERVAFFDRYEKIAGEKGAKS